MTYIIDIEEEGIVDVLRWSLISDPVKLVCSVKRHEVVNKIYYSGSSKALTLDDLDRLTEGLSVLGSTGLLWRATRSAWALEALRRRLAFSILGCSRGILRVLRRARAQIETASCGLVWRGRHLLFVGLNVFIGAGCLVVSGALEW